MLTGRSDWSISERPVRMSLSLTDHFPSLIFAESRVLIRAFRFSMASAIISAPPKKSSVYESKSKSSFKNCKQGELGQVPRVQLGAWAHARIGRPHKRCRKWRYKVLNAECLGQYQNHTRFEPVSISSVKKNLTKHFNYVTNEDEAIATSPAQLLHNILLWLCACTHIRSRKNHALLLWLFIWLNK